jgi:hypothetical protein
MGSTEKAMRKIGLRPQLSALRPTRIAIGSITPWAATTQNDIMAVASLGNSSASFWPTSGRSGALAKWNNMAQTAKIMRGGV